MTTFLSLFINSFYYASSALDTKNFKSLEKSVDFFLCSTISFDVYFIIQGCSKTSFMVILLEGFLLNRSNKINVIIID